MWCDLKHANTRVRPIPNRGMSEDRLPLSILSISFGSPTVKGMMDVIGELSPNGMCDWYSGLSRGMHAWFEVEIERWCGGSVDLCATSPDRVDTVWYVSWFPVRTRWSSGGEKWISGRSSSHLFPRLSTDGFDDDVVSEGLRRKCWSWFRETPHGRRRWEYYITQLVKLVSVEEPDQVSNNTLINRRCNSHTDIHFVLIADE